jgi:hypothetical protein
VEVTLTRNLEEAWDHLIRRVATLSEVVTGEARIREPLDGGVGAPTLAALEQVLANEPDWEFADGVFRHALDGGYVAYHVATQELEIVAQLSSEVQASAEATAASQGQVAGTFTARGEGVYYDDGYAGITEADARRNAETRAEADADRQRRGLIDDAISAAEREHDSNLTATAQASAQAALADQVSARSAELAEQANQQLAAVGIQGRNVFHRALAQAYREAVLAYARNHYAEGISCTERDGVLEIEFEMQVS